MVTYVFRKPNYPVIIIAGQKAFRAISKASLDRLIRREGSANDQMRVLDRTWEWFEYVPEHDALAPSLIHHVAPTKQQLIDLIANRSNKPGPLDVDVRRSVASRTRDEIFHELLEQLPTSSG